MKKHHFGFTLVELIVVIVILGILSTIGFVSYSGYLGGARDSNRITQLQGITDSLNLYGTKKTLPLPDDYVTVTASGTTIGYQGNAGVNILELINHQSGGKDPKDDSYFTYYLSKDRKSFQLLAFLEESGGLQSFIPGISQTYAADLTKRFPKVYGKKLGVLTQDVTNIPIQEIPSIITAGSLDIATTTDSYDAHLTDAESVSGTGGVLYVGVIVASIGSNNKSCKEILENNAVVSGVDGVYSITPTGGTTIEVYCDMTTDGGGWTFFGHMDSNSGGSNFFEGGVGTYQSSRVDDGTKYFLGVDNFSHTEMMVTLDSPNPIISDAVNKIVFYKYTLGHLGFNKGPIPCQGLTTGFSYKTQIGGSYTSGGTTNYCDAINWFPRTVGNTNYLVLFQTTARGNYWGIGIGGNNLRYHDGWWYLR